MLLSLRRLASSPLIIVTAGILAILFILAALSKPSWPSTPFSTTHTSNPEHAPATQAPLPSEQEKTQQPPQPPAVPPNVPPHPIDELIKQAAETFESSFGEQATGRDVSEAAQIYRERRQRHPPPGFAEWFAYARSQDALIVEDMFDQIYHDLEPFWSAEPATMRQQAIDWPFSISIREGTAKKRQKRLVSGEWLDYWVLMLKGISQYLPDVDIALNQIDESRIIVPWDAMTVHMQSAAESRDTERPATREEAITVYPTREALSFNKDEMSMTGLIKDGVWQNTQKFWEILRLACPPDSEAHNYLQDEDLSKPPVLLESFPTGSHDGYVSNWTIAKDPCQHPELRNVHGNLVSPRFTSVNTTLFPLFSGCKIQGINNEILLPAAKYFSDEEEFSAIGTHTPWESMKGGIVWRGQATGGAHRADNWKRFHRQRFVAMLNGTLVSKEENVESTAHKPAPAIDVHVEAPHQIQEVKGAFAGIDPHPAPDPKLANAANFGGLAHNIPRPDASQNPYNLSALQTQPSTLGNWIGPKADVGFDHLMCAPWKLSILGDGKKCGYLDPYYHAVDRIDMAEQFTYKYLPDVDGNSYSGRYRAFLLSGSLPIKATIWSEWHDSRLVPWKHFVPLHNSYVDLWGVMEYFWGYGTGDGGIGSGHGMDFVKGGFREGENNHPELNKRGHDVVARRIAEEGRDWASKVLRKEDMLVYVYRLVLEYARIVSDERDKMMWVDDLF